MEKLTFKQYLESKNRLREALERTPVRKATYTLRKYCKLPVGESKEDREYIALKPKQNIIVEWHYNDIENPTPVALVFENVKDVSERTKYKTFWNGQKLQKWLLRNTREQN